MCSLHTHMSKQHDWWKEKSRPTEWDMKYFFLQCKLRQWINISFIVSLLFNCKHFLSYIFLFLSLSKHFLSYILLFLSLSKYICMSEGKCWLHKVVEIDLFVSYIFSLRCPGLTVDSAVRNHAWWCGKDMWWWRSNQG